MSNCFIIMPISTPDWMLEKYGNDKNHFQHVLDHLFLPALEQAEIEAIPPAAEGAEVIQGRIIKHIETTDLVLCDISCLNPNVFFELGIRTALNKPVCYVKDDVTQEIPFDTTILNHHTYRSALHTWELKEDIEQLLAHIKKSVETSGKGNSLWKYFALSSEARSIEGPATRDDRLEYLAMQIDSMKTMIEKQDETPWVPVDDPERVPVMTIMRKLRSMAKVGGAAIGNWQRHGGSLLVTFADLSKVDRLLAERLVGYANANGYDLDFR